MGKRRDYPRCEHCGEFVRDGNLFTLFGVEHAEAESVAVCYKCCSVRYPYDEAFQPDIAKRQASVDYWRKWLDARFAAVQS